MAELVVIGYPDEGSAEGALATLGTLQQDLIMYRKATPDKTIAALVPFGGHVLKSSLSAETEEAIDHALAGDEA
jgi:uncharacterized membrane protein